MPPSSPPLGAHVSAAGGVDRALDRALEAGYETAQVFVKSPNRWAAPALDPAVTERFRDKRSALPGPIVAHAAYLVNLAARDATVLSRSRRALGEELERCDRLGIDALVVHPGAHLGAGPEKGVERVAASVRAVLAQRPAGRCRLLLENTAGQGTVLGRRLEELAQMIERIDAGERVGVCVDTCHAYAAGYALDRRAAYDAFWRELDERIGRRALGCLHLNDSRTPLGSRRDRHANLGEGEIGAGLFRRLVADASLARVPMLLETPLGEDRSGHRRDLARLRAWRDDARRAQRS